MAFSSWYCTRTETEKTNWPHSSIFRLWILPIIAIVWQKEVLKRICCQCLCIWNQLIDILHVIQSEHSVIIKSTFDLRIIEQSALQKHAVLTADCRLHFSSKPNYQIERMHLCSLHRPVSCRSVSHECSQNICSDICWPPAADDGWSSMAKFIAKLASV